MKINRQEWIERLTKLYVAVSPSTISPAYSCFLFSGGKITTSNGVITMSTATAIIPKEGKYVPAGHLMKLLNSLPDEEVELIFEENILKIRTNRLKGKLTTVSEEVTKQKQPKLKAVNIGSYPDFIEGITFCKTVSSEDLTTGALCGVHLEDNLVLGSDRYRIFTWKRNDYIAERITCTLPVIFIDILSKYKEEIRELTFYVHKSFEVDHVNVVLNDSTIIKSIVLPGKYPDLVQYFPKNSNKHIVIPFNDEFIQAVNRQANFLSNIAAVDRELDISIKGSSCKFRVVNSTYGTLEEEIDMDVLDETITADIRINPALITNALNDVIDDQRKIVYYPEINLLMVEGGQCKCVMPTLVKEENKKGK
jgi:DNA polymerase III sliding clamp (beta) subunit (PCNA family)